MYIHFCCIAPLAHVSVAGAERAHWVKYDENMAARDAWAQDLLSSFKEDVRTVRDFYTSPQNSPIHAYSTNVQQPASNSKTQGHVQGQGQNRKGQGHVSVPRQTRLLEACSVLRLEDFSLYRVSTASDQRRSTPKKFLSSDKKQLLLPPEMSSIHVDYTDYYFPEGIDFPGTCISTVYIVTASILKRLKTNCAAE